MRYVAAGVLATGTALVAGLAIGSWLERWRIRDHQPWEPPIPKADTIAVPSVSSLDADFVPYGYKLTPGMHPWPDRDYGPGIPPRGY